MGTKTNLDNMCLGASGAGLGTKLDALITMANEMKADYNLLRSQLLNRSLGTAGLAIAATPTKLKITNSVDFTINGVAYTKAATDNITMTAQAQQAAETYCLYLVSINASGTVKVTKGTEVATDTAVLPALPANEAPLGYIKVATAAATTFTSGTTALNAAGITDTYVDLSVMNGGTSASTAVSAADVGTLT